MANDNSWLKICKDYKVLEHDFRSSPFPLSAQQIKKSCQGFKKTGEKEVRLLCKQDTREDRPQVFIDNNLFILPVKNKFYNIVKGEGYIDIHPIDEKKIAYKPKLDFVLETSHVGDSEMQYLDFAYASSVIRTFMQDPTLVLTIRGRKYTPDFSFNVGKNLINVSGVQTEVDAGYEGKNQVVLIEAKNINASNIIIRQLFYPYRQWQLATKKKVSTLFFEKDKRDNSYAIRQFIFTDPNDYNSIEFVKAAKYEIRD